MSMIGGHTMNQNPRRALADKWRIAIQRLLAARAELRELDRELTAIGLLDTLSDEDLVDTSASTPIAYPVSVAELLNSITSVRAIEAWVAENWHDTNLYKVKP